MSELVNKYLTKADIASIEILKKAIKSDTITITCMGLYNHGKSTLLNTLIKDFEYKTFKTADVRETSVNKTVELDNIKFVDTPGLNARVHDDKRVMDAIKESDINLFVHTVTTGEFVEKEMEFLHNVKNHWKSPQEFIDRTIFVVTRIDKASNEIDITKTVEKMSSQISEIFNSEATIIPVSAVRYTKGHVESKNLLIKKSNIEALEKSMGDLSNEILSSIRETRRVRLENKYADLIRRFSSKFQENKLEITKQKRERKKYHNSLNKDITTIESTLKNMYSKLGD